MSKVEANPVFTQEVEVLIEKPSEWSKEQLESHFIERFKVLFPMYDAPKYQISVVGVLQNNTLRASVGAFLKKQEG
ncbi:MAG: hypothetical protein J0M15_01980 [Deltaproteobacteria bacterium]|jgi:hypothetical protein|nr:hypothetical protein [Deltaproteobacteria bacterium]